MKALGPKHMYTHWNPNTCTLTEIKQIHILIIRNIMSMAERLTSSLQITIQRRQHWLSVRSPIARAILDQFPVRQKKKTGEIPYCYLYTQSSVVKLTCKGPKFKNKVDIICSMFIHNSKPDHLYYIRSPFPNFSTYSSNFRSSSLVHGPLFMLGSKAFTHLHKDKKISFHTTNKTPTF